MHKREPRHTDFSPGPQTRTGRVHVGGRLGGIMRWLILWAESPPFLTLEFSCCFRISALARLRQAHCWAGGRPGCAQDSWALRTPRLHPGGGCARGGAPVPRRRDTHGQEPAPVGTPEATRWDLATRGTSTLTTLRPGGKGSAPGGTKFKPGGTAGTGPANQRAQRPPCPPSPGSRLTRSRPARAPWRPQRLLSCR